MPKYRRFRQGDVVIRPLNKLPNGLKKNKNNVVAYGEVTGHQHEIFGNCEVLCDEKGNLFLDAKNDTEIKHVYETGAPADHKPISIDPGYYRVNIQREYEPEGHRQVRD